MSVAGVISLAGDAVLRTDPPTRTERNGCVQNSLNPATGALSNSAIRDIRSWRIVDMQNSTTGKSNPHPGRKPRQARDRAIDGGGGSLAAADFARHLIGDAH